MPQTPVPPVDESVVLVPLSGAEVMAVDQPETIHLGRLLRVGAVAHAREEGLEHMPDEAALSGDDLSFASVNGLLAQVHKSVPTEMYESLVELLPAGFGDDRAWTVRQLRLGHRTVYGWIGSLAQSIAQGIPQEVEILAEDTEPEQDEPIDAHRGQYL